MDKVESTISTGVLGWLLLRAAGAQALVSKKSSLAWGLQLLTIGDWDNLHLITLKTVPVWTLTVCTSGLSWADDWVPCGFRESPRQQSGRRSEHMSMDIGHRHGAQTGLSIQYRVMEGARTQKPLFHLPIPCWRLQPTYVLTYITLETCLALSLPGNWVLWQSTWDPGRTVLILLQCDTAPSKKLLGICYHNGSWLGNDDFNYRIASLDTRPIAELVPVPVFVRCWPCKSHRISVNIILFN